MKINSKVIIAATFLFVAVLVKAETTYVPCGDVIYSRDGDYGAKLLSDWEKQNPDKRIVSITVRSGVEGRFYGFWITWELRAK